MKRNSASVVAIGNEILLGQILNKNASSLSKRLLDYKINVDRHIVVADEFDEITKALDFAKERSNLIFVSGGLGPTRDDLTREAVAKYLDLALSFDEAVYKRLVENLSNRGVSVTDNHKKQAMFPEGSQVIRNDRGTADGFYLEKDGLHFFVIPGPPPEIDSCWQNYIDKKLKNELSNQSSKNITSFHILGLPESEVADQVEKLVAKYSGLETEYRLHLPYVELRFQYDEKFKQNIDLLEKDIRNCFGLHFAYKNEEDLGKYLKDVFKEKKIIFIDGFSSGYLNQRLGQLGFKADVFSLNNNKADYKIEGYDSQILLPKKEEGQDWYITINDKQYEVDRLTSRKLRKKLEYIKLLELALWKIVEIYDEGT